MLARWPRTAAFVTYFATSFLYFGLPIVEHPRRYVISNDGIDASIFVWSFAWWPHAVLHAQNPLVTHAIWAPTGQNLAWTATAPGLAILFSPLTLLLGPAVAYNIAAVLMPALAAWTAFLLCRRLTGKFWPSLAGGYLFGFSAYILGHEQGHLHVTSVFLVPVAALLVLRFLDGELGGWGFVWRFGLLIAAQITFSTEIAFTLTLAVIIGLVLGFAFDSTRRRKIGALLLPLAGAYALAAVLVSPLLYYAFSDFHRSSLNPPAWFPADPVNLFVPTQLVAAGHWGLSSISGRFLGNDAENGTYLGIPVLIMIALFAWRRWRSAGGRVLLVALGTTLVCAFGTALHVDGHRIVAFPWRAVSSLPLLNNILPVRLTMYAALISAVVVALWAASNAPRWARITLPVLAVLSLVPFTGHVPGFQLGYWKTNPTRLAFFENGAYKACLPPGANVLVFPYRDHGFSMLWQAESGFRYRMSEGFVSPEVPANFVGPAQATQAFTYEHVPSRGDVDQYVHDTGTTTILVQPWADPTVQRFSELLTKWYGQPQAVADVLLYHVAGTSAPPRCS